MKKDVKCTILILTIAILNVSMAFADVNESKTVESRIAGDNAKLLEEIKWLQTEAVVFTASKQEQKIYKAASVMTVYTAEDIKRQGLRSVQEIIERTAGFFNARSATNPLIGARGITTGDNEHFLLLIDGHNMNSIVDLGPGSYHLYPFLSNVERVEIVRGPGSTLWGSDAALGIIHIITKNGKDINGLQATVDYASEDKYRYANVLYGKETGDDQDIMFSFTLAESDGYPKHGFYPIDPSLLPLPSYAQKTGPMDKINDSWEFYGKIRMKDFTFTCRGSDMMDIRLYQSKEANGDPDKVKYNRRKHFSLGLDNLKKIDENTSLETKVFSDLIEKSQVAGNPNISSDLDHVEDSDSSKETRNGFEVLYRTRLFDDHDILSGFKFVQTEVDPISHKEIFPLAGSSATLEYNLLVVPDEEDKNYAAYIEDNWHVVEDLNIIAGVRVDKNTLREENTQMLPRLGLVWSMDEQWTAKYLYNTGYVRPPIAKSFLEQHPVVTEFDWNTWTFVDFLSVGASEAEEVYTHDLQFSFVGSNFQSSLTGYYVTVENSFNFLLDTANENGVDYIMTYINTNTITSYGVEYEFRHSINKMVEWYGNFSEALKAEIDKFESSVEGIGYTQAGFQIANNDKKLIGFPRQIWNVGINIFFYNMMFTDHISCNVHLRGFRDRWDQKQDGSGGYEKSGTQNFADINLRLHGFFKESLDISIYAKNLLDGNALNVFGTTILRANDNQNTLHFLGHYPDRGRSVGIKASYKF